MEIEGATVGLLTAFGGFASVASLTWWLSSKFTQVLIQIHQLAQSIDKTYASKDSQKILREELLERISDIKTDHSKLETRVRNIETASK